MQTLDREKYLGILRKDGLSAALTSLHRDYNEMEFEVFEGREGWQPKHWEQIQEVRAFSRELWDYVLTQPE